VHPMASLFRSDLEIRVTKSIHFSVLARMSSRRGCLSLVCVVLSCVGRGLATG
jgi:hypothetical protein